MDPDSAVVGCPASLRSRSAARVHGGDRDDSVGGDAESAVGIRVEVGNDGCDARLDGSGTRWHR